MTPDKIAKLKAGDEPLKVTDDYAAIWLTPKCEEERSWCIDELDDCNECNSPAVKYIRADIVEQLRATLTSVEAELAALKARGDGAFDEGHMDGYREGVVNAEAFNRDLAQGAIAIDQELAGENLGEMEAEYWITSLRESLEMPPYDGRPTKPTDTKDESK